MTTFSRLGFGIAPFVAVLSLFAVAGCGEETIDDGPLAGEINGKAWTFQGGSAEDIFGDGELWISLHSSTAADPCGFNPFDGDHVLIVRPPEPTDKGLSLSNNITIVYDGSNNDIMTSGRLVIDTITTTTIGGGLVTSRDNHDLSGRWEVPICPTL